MRLKKTFRSLNNSYRYEQLLRQAKNSSKSLPVNPNAGFVVSIASYPERDPGLPAVFEALSKQSTSPRKWVLVLSVEDYQQIIPSHLKQLEDRGLEIMWVKNNPFAVKKLIPVREAYPDVAIITLDDDIIYHPNLIKGLVEQSKRTPERVIGYTGKTIVRKRGEIKMQYRDDKSADSKTPSGQVYLIGKGGIFYPANSLHEKAFDIDAVSRIVPGRGSDFWFWAAAHANNKKQICLGVSKKNSYGFPVPPSDKTAPRDQPGAEILEKRFQKTIDYFGIRELLQRQLPNLP